MRKFKCLDNMSLVSRVSLDLGKVYIADEHHVKDDMVKINGIWFSLDRFVELFDDRDPITIVPPSLPPKNSKKELDDAEEARLVQILCHSRAKDECACGGGMKKHQCPYHKEDEKTPANYSRFC